MGEVYRARDTRLDRTVAVKILPVHLSDSPDAKQRFEREARAISSLNHPNICTLYDVGHQDGTDYLVMEFLEGETLAERLMKGPVPPEQVLKYGIEICEGLEAAHSRGVVHRDLKPGNIMLTKIGAKLMDFGLAKAFPAETPPSSGLTATLMSPAGSQPLTAHHMVVGTFQYMSPEQVEGKEADARSDIFALGAVLYEMATGKKAFSGKNQASIVAAILASEPQPISTVQPMSPPALDRVVKVCVTKDRDERWQTAHDVKLQLQWIAEGGSQAGTPAPVVARRKNRERILEVVAGLAVVTSLLLGWLYWKSRSVETRAIRSYIKPPAHASFTFSGPGSGFALSPDGARLVYSAVNEEGKSMLWVRPLNSLQAQPLAGTEGGAYPFWSPDGRSIGFFAGGKLKKIEASGGPPLTLADTPLPRGGSWGRDGVIIFAPSTNMPLFSIPDSGGTATQVTTLDAKKNETTHRWPCFLPDGRHFLFLSGNPFVPRENSTSAIEVGSLDSKEVKRLVYAHASGIYAAGHIFFLRQNTLMAQPFDAKRLEFTGDAFPIADPVLEDTGSVKAVFSASDNGNLTYGEGSSSAARQLVWLDRNGKEVGKVEGQEGYSGPTISRDGKKIAYTLESSGYDIWSYDIGRGVKTRLTFGSASAQANLTPVWSPDGRWIAYTCVPNGKFSFCRKPSDGSGSEEVLLEGNEQLRYLSDLSPDGKFLAYREPKQGTFGIWILPLNGERKPYPFVQSQFPQNLPSFSPDGKWVAYCSSESGEYKVYVVPFPGPGGKWQVSPGGGCTPHWRRDGRELFYLSMDSKLMAADVKATGSSFEVGAVHTLFDARLISNFGSYTVTADGQRFIVVQTPDQPTAAITLVVNWPTELKK
jgi:serine/threonine protein kinase